MNRQSVTKAQKPKNSTLLPPTDILQRKTINRTNFGVVNTRSPSEQQIDNPGLQSIGPHFIHDFSKIPVRLNSPYPVQAKLKFGQPDDKYEQEADRVADEILNHRTAEPVSINQTTASDIVQKQESKPGERSNTPPSTTAFPGQSSESPKEEKKRKIDEGFEKLGEGLANKVLSTAEQIPGVKEIYTALEELFKHPVVMTLAGIGYSSTVGTVIVKNAVDKKAEGTPGAFPIEETQFGVKGSFDISSGLSGIKFKTPIGDLPPSLSSKEPAQPLKPLFAPPSLVPSQDLIGRRLRAANRQAMINSWVLSQQGLILNPLKEAEQKEKQASKNSQPFSWVTPLFKRLGPAKQAAISAGELQSAIVGRNTSGQPMERSLRQQMEKRFGVDFSKVRIHNGATASRVAHSLRAQAFTMDDHIIFGSGEYQPASSKGSRLLAHELTHVVQHRADSSN